MDHVAIMKKEWLLIDKILKGEKKIESRWYKNKVAPWNKIASGDIIYFKDSGNPVIAKAIAYKVLQFHDLNSKISSNIIKSYGRKIALSAVSLKEWSKDKRYCILIFLKNPQKISQPFNINKKGFGSASAWITVEDINKIRIPI